jgi:hypothetical protein
VNRKQGEPYKYLKLILKAIVFTEFFIKNHWQVFLNTYTSQPKACHGTIKIGIGNSAIIRL